MDVDDYYYLLDNPLLKILLIKERLECENEMFASREENGEHHTLFQELLRQPNKFQEYFRMAPQTFCYILNGIKEKLIKQSNFRTCISPEEKLAVTLRFLSTGISFRALSFSYRMSHTTIRQIAYDTCFAIWDWFYEQHMPTPSTESLKTIANDFWGKWNFPNCVGCIDGKHIRIKCPQHSGSFYYNYKQYFSIVLQGIADANYKFITIDVGGYGKQSDGGIFSFSTVYNRLETNNFNMPKDEVLPSTDISAPYVLLGDEAYPLKPYLLKPYSRQNLTDHERIFNYRLSRARRCVECAFGILVAKWRCLKTELQVNPENVDTIVKCVCLLHNIVIDSEGYTSLGQDIIPEGNATVSRRYNRSGMAACIVRDIYKDYFNSPAGEVQFQYNVLNY